MLRNASGTSSRRTSMSVGIGISAHKVVLGFNWVALLVVHVGFQGSGHIQLPSAWHVTVYPGLSYTAGDREGHTQNREARAPIQLHSLTCEGTYLTMSIANFTPIAIRSKHAQHFHSGYVQIPMAVKEAACAKLSIPWRPNLGIQRSWLSRGDHSEG